MSWIDRILPAGISRTDGSKRSTVPEGVWTKCIKCEAVLYKPDLERNASVCPKCDHHMRIGARERLDIFLDADGREEVFADIEPIDRLRFRDKKKYVARLAAAQKSTGERDALVAMRGKLHKQPVVAVAFEFGFHGGSMGQAVGEKFSRAAQLALKERIPLVCFAASGGARMQEALISLMQMAKTSAVIERMHTESVPYISVLTDPIYGGVSASLALLGDLNIAEPDARAGFAGPNIIEQTIRQKLPKGFQRSEFLLEHGAIDMIVPRMELRDTIARILAKLMGEPLPEALRAAPEPAVDVEDVAALAGAAAVAETADDALATAAVRENNAQPEQSDGQNGGASDDDSEASRAAQAIGEGGDGGEGGERRERREHREGREGGDPEESSAADDAQESDSEQAAESGLTEGDTATGDAESDDSAGDDAEDAGGVEGDALEASRDDDAAAAAEEGEAADAPDEDGDASVNEESSDKKTDG